MAGLLSQENRRALARGLLDTTQAASNSAASTVSAPVDALAWALRKAGVPIPQAPFGGSDWMKAQGLMRDVQSPVANAVGETIGNVLPIVAAAKAPQIAGGLLKAAENASASAPLNAATRNQAGAIVWHGSPHKFDRFDASKIGTGEGAQAYGHGLYLAESPDVAQSYTRVFHGPGATKPDWAYVNIGGKSLEDLTAGMEPSVVGHVTSALKAAGGDVGKAAKAFAERTALNANAPVVRNVQKVLDGGIGTQVDLSAIPSGNFYKVDLPDDQIAKMLDWDKPLGQQSAAVRGVADQFLNGPMSVMPTGYKVLKNGRGQYQPMAPGGVAMTSSAFDTPKQAEQYALEMLNEFRLKPNTKGNQLYDMFDRDPKSAADMLQRAGIPGIRYLDGGSRGTASGTSNFVVFPGNEGLLNILERNGQPIR
jgi:hypothetical protein